MELCDLNSADSGAAAALLESKNEELPEPNRDELVDLELEKHDAFLCSICKEVMTDPVTDPYGNTYQKSAILEWLQIKAVSPMNNQPLTADQLTPNISLRDAIDEQRTIILREMSGLGRESQEKSFSVSSTIFQKKLKKWNKKDLDVAFEAVIEVLDVQREGIHQSLVELHDELLETRRTSNNSLREISEMKDAAIKCIDAATLSLEGNTPVSLQTFHSKLKELARKVERIEEKVQNEVIGIKVFGQKYSTGYVGVRERMSDTEQLFKDCANLLKTKVTGHDIGAGTTVGAGTAALATGTGFCIAGIATSFTGFGALIGFGVGVPLILAAGGSVPATIALIQGALKLKKKIKAIAKGRELFESALGALKDHISMLKDCKDELLAVQDNVSDRNRETSVKDFLYSIIPDGSSYYNCDDVVDIILREGPRDRTDVGWLLNHKDINLANKLNQAGLGAVVIRDLKNQCESIENDPRNSSAWLANAKQKLKAVHTKLWELIPEAPVTMIKRNSAGTVEAILATAANRTSAGWTSKALDHLPMEDVTHT